MQKCNVYNMDNCGLIVYITFVFFYFPITLCYTVSIFKMEHIFVAYNFSFLMRYSVRGDNNNILGLQKPYFLHLNFLFYSTQYAKAGDFSLNVIFAYGVPDGIIRFLSRDICLMYIMHFKFFVLYTFYVYCVQCWNSTRLRSTFLDLKYLEKFSLKARRCHIVFPRRKQDP